MDAMVTARMSVGKKEAGSAVLRELGLTASQAINELYDYLIAHHAVPFGASDTSRAERIARAVEETDTIPRASLDPHYAKMGARDARAERLSRRSSAGGDSL